MNLIKVISAASLLTATLPVIAGDLGPADLSNQEMLQAAPMSGKIWEANCGTIQRNASCMIRLLGNELVVDDEYTIKYSQIFATESHDSYASIARLAKGDPAYTSWDNYRKNNVKYLKNTVLIAYTSKNGQKSTAIFAFPENRYSDFYGFANAIRMITYGAQAQQPMEPQVLPVE